MSTPEDRLWNRLWQELDYIKKKLDDKVNYKVFDDFKREIDERSREIEQQLEDLKKVAVSPDQVTTLIASKLEESQARGITRRDRWVRWTVAGLTGLTSLLLLYDRIYPR